MTAPEDREEWRVVPGFDGWYEASSLGRVRSWRTRERRPRRADEPVVLAGRDIGEGHRHVRLTHPVLGEVDVAVHHLVLAAFGQPRPHGLVCDHINASRSDNRVENLRSVSAAENVAHAASLGRIWRRPSPRSVSTLSEADVAAMRRLRAEGVLVKELAARFRVGTSTVSRIVHGQTWNGVQ